MEGTTAKKFTVGLFLFIIIILLEGCALSQETTEKSSTASFPEDNSSAFEHFQPSLTFAKENECDIFTVKRIANNTEHFLMSSQKKGSFGENVNTFFFYIVNMESGEKELLLTSNHSDVFVFGSDENKLFLINDNTVYCFFDNKLLWKKTIDKDRLQRIISNNAEGYVWQDDLLNLYYTNWDGNINKLFWPATYQKNTTKFPDIDAEGNIVDTWSDSLTFCDDGRQVLLKEHQGDYLNKIVLYDFANEKEHIFSNLFLSGEIFFGGNIPWITSCTFDGESDSEAAGKFVLVANSSGIQKLETPFPYMYAFPASDGILLLDFDNVLHYVDNTLKNYQSICCFEENDILINAFSDNKFVVVFFYDYSQKARIVQILEKA